MRAALLALLLAWPAQGALAVVSLLAETSSVGNGATTKVTSVVTPDADTLLLCSAAIWRNGQESIGAISGMGLTWTPIDAASGFIATGGGVMYAWMAVASGAVAPGAITFSSIGGTGSRHISWTVDEVTGLADPSVVSVLQTGNYASGISQVSSTDINILGLNASSISLMWCAANTVSAVPCPLSPLVLSSATTYLCSTWRAESGVKNSITPFCDPGPELTSQAGILVALRLPTTTSTISRRPTGGRQ